MRCSHVVSDIGLPVLPPNLTSLPTPLRAKSANKNKLRTNMVAKGETIKGERLRGAVRGREGWVQIRVHFLLGPVSRVHQLLKRRLLESVSSIFLSIQCVESVELSSFLSFRGDRFSSGFPCTSDSFFSLEQDTVI